MGDEMVCFGLRIDCYHHKILRSCGKCQERLLPQLWRKQCGSGNRICECNQPTRKAESQKAQFLRIQRSKQSRITFRNLEVTYGLKY